MATNINVIKNTFNVNQSRKYNVVNTIVNSMIYRSYPNGNSGYEDYHNAADMISATKVKYVAGNPYTVAYLKLDPSKLTREQLLKLEAEVAFCAKWNVPAYVLVNEFLNDLPLPTDEEMEVIVKLSKAGKFKFTRMEFYHTLIKSKAKNAPEQMGNDELTSILNEWFYNQA